MHAPRVFFLHYTLLRLTQYIAVVACLANQKHVHVTGSYGYHDDDNDEGDGDGDDDKSLEDDETRQEREAFARFVLDWHLRRQLKTALLDVGRVVPYILMQFLADWREAELLWIFQVCTLLLSSHYLFVLFMLSVVVMRVVVVLLPVLLLLLLNVTRCCCLWS